MSELGHSRRFAAMLQRQHSFQSGRLHRRQHRYHPHMNKRGSASRSPVTPGDGRSDPIAAVRWLSRRAKSGCGVRARRRGLGHREGAMSVEEVTLALFAACNSIRVVAYVPQILKAAIDRNGASSISCTTWPLFLIAHVSTFACALINRSA